MSSKFNKVKTYYDKGLWNLTKVRNAVVKNWNSAQEIEQITGEPYETA